MYFSDMCTNQWKNSDIKGTKKNQTYTCGELYIQSDKEIKG